MHAMFNTRNKPWQGIRVCVLAALSYAAALDYSRAQNANSPQLSKVIVGGLASVQFLPVYTAIARGIFAKHGLEIDLVDVNTTAAILNNEINMMIKSADTGVLAAARGRPIPALVMIQQRNSLSFESAASLGYKKQDYPAVIQKFKGKTIALPVRGSSSDAFAKTVMADAGMEEGRDYNFVVLGTGANIIAALKAGRVDGAILWPPFSQQAYVEKAAIPIIQMAEGEGPEIFSRAAGVGIVVNADYLKSHQKEAKQFVAAIVEATAFNREYEKNKEALIDIAVRYTGITDRQVLAEAIRVTSALSYPGVSCRAWLLTAQSLIKTSTIDRAPPCEDMISPLAPEGPLKQ